MNIGTPIIERFLNAESMNNTTCVLKIWSAGMFGKGHTIFRQMTFLHLFYLLCSMLSYYPLAPLHLVPRLQELHASQLLQLSASFNLWLWESLNSNWERTDVIWLVDAPADELHLFWFAAPLICNLAWRCPIVVHLRSTKQLIACTVLLAFSSCICMWFVLSVIVLLLLVLIRYRFHSLAANRLLRDIYYTLIFHVHRWKLLRTMSSAGAFFSRVTRKYHFDRLFSLQFCRINVRRQWWGAAKFSSQFRNGVVYSRSEIPNSTW